ncbi:hypothetical protein H9X78_16705, partial [Clostridium saudiense]|nr:hypothetical protein [Clostridium saudiense]
VTMCKRCLNDVLIGKKYVEEKLTSYWLDVNVMFLPHSFNDVVEEIYDSSSMKNNEEKNLILNIREDEKTVLEMLGKGNTETDIVFFEKEASKTFYIYHTIKSLLPSKFGYLAELLDKYDIR